MGINFILAILILSTQSILGAVSSQRRFALINGEKVAIDTSTSQKGEGLRYYLEKDPIALEYLEQYTEGNRPNWYRVTLSTIGIGLIAGGALSTSNRDLLVGMGVGIFGLSFLYAKTREAEREEILKNSVIEYNKRNKPEIILAPYYSPLDQSWGFRFGRSF